ncbi:NAD-dependent epimerase/dehydratase family protein [Tropicibacter sp. S64]|uniref:NAD-dependent epimerase/dehydratase family protein n=1 Tax=Tropicibacter sp. S64 TaxID=3415122 RepID=UPI003C7BC84E
MRFLLTGVTGKVGASLLPALLAEPRLAGASVTALCNNRVIPETDRVTVVRGSLADPGVLGRAMAGVTHVVHMAAVKESPDLFIDVAIRGMFHLLEAARLSDTVRQVVLIGGDCAVGHAFQPFDGPVTEAAPRKAYPGVYALTKVIEEVMLETYQHQYGLNGCILRAPWIMEKDDFRFAMTFGPEQFGGPDWAQYLDPEQIARAQAENLVPLVLDRDGQPLKRNFVHVDDLVAAILAAIDNPAAERQLFNIAMTQPVCYGAMAAYLHRTRGLEAIRVPTDMIGNLLDNAHARQRLGWSPTVGLEDLIERAWRHERPANEPRKVWYPG